MANEAICKLCLSRDVELEDCDGYPQMICKICGYIDENQSSMFTTTDQELFGEGSSHVQDGSFHSTNLPKGANIGFDQLPRKVRLKQTGHYPIDSICSSFGLRSSSLIEECWDLFTRAYEHAAFINAKRDKKRCLAVACVLIVCSNHGYPTSLLQISNLTGVDAKYVGAAKKEILHHLGIECKYVDIEELVEPMSIKFGLSSKVTDMAVQIIQLCKDVCLSASCIRENIIVSALYLSWQSDGLPATRKQTLKKFAAKYKIKSTDITSTRLKEMKEVLLKLCSKIPWLEESEISAEKLPYHLEDIISHRKVLMAEYKLNYIKDLENGADEEDESEDNKPSENTEQGMKVSPEKTKGIDTENDGSEECTATTLKREVDQVDGGDDIHWFKRKKSGKSY